MQHVTKEKIDIFVAALKKEITALQAPTAAKANNEIRKVLKNGEVVIGNNDSWYNVSGVRIGQ